MDSANPVIALCTDGMRAEADGRNDDARAPFMQAWTACRDDFDACVAAHYLARHQDPPEETYRWNREALMRAEAVGDARVQEFYPSLYLNMGWSCEVLSDADEARRYYERAAGIMADLPDGAYADLVRGGIAAGLERTKTGP